MGPVSNFLTRLGMALSLDRNHSLNEDAIRERLLLDAYESTIRGCKCEDCQKLFLEKCISVESVVNSKRLEHEKFLREVGVKKDK